ncbi:hypothetical protein HPB50_007025 [Hyalomma asiaticum]|uniref:Uncharacterized protein n=1 Tax=Hyalomma asiaticum TaxID=266040 RepID=A0ACB7T3U9_HYAAI|nr:hypothetical protein HPB50_007025 [Hyalomma asiaticum]
MWSALRYKLPLKQLPLILLANMAGRCQHCETHASIPGAQPSDTSQEVQLRTHPPKRTRASNSDLQYWSRDERPPVTRGLLHHLGLGWTLRHQNGTISRDLVVQRATPAQSDVPTAWAGECRLRQLT